MSTTSTTLVGPYTRSRAMLSSQPVKPIPEMVDAVEQLAKRKRGQRRSPTTTPASVSTADSEIAVSSPTSDPFSTGSSEPVALQVWNELFEEDDFNKIAEQSDYIRVNVAGLLETAQIERMAYGIMEELKKKKEAFIKLGGNDARNLREKLHKLFTGIVIRKAKTELSESKEAIADKLAEISTDLGKRIESRNSLGEKQELTAIQVQKAHTALHELLTISKECLSNTTPEANAEPGNSAETLQLLVPFLSEVVGTQQLALPAVLNGPRTVGDQAGIYKEDLEKLSSDVWEKFE